MRVCVANSFYSSIQVESSNVHRFVVVVVVVFFNFVCRIAIAHI